MNNIQLDQWKFIIIIDYINPLIITGMFVETNVDPINNCCPFLSLFKFIVFIQILFHSIRLNCRNYFLIKMDTVKQTISGNISTEKSISMNAVSSAMDSCLNKLNDNNNTGGSSKNDDDYKAPPPELSISFFDTSPLPMATGQELHQQSMEDDDCIAGTPTKPFNMHYSSNLSINAGNSFFCLLFPFTCPK